MSLELAARATRRKPQRRPRLGQSWRRRGRGSLSGGCGGRRRWGNWEPWWVGAAGCRLAVFAAELRNRMGFLASLAGCPLVAAAGKRCRRDWQRPAAASASSQRAAAARRAQQQRQGAAAAGRRPRRECSTACLETSAAAAAMTRSEGVTELAVCCLFCCSPTWQTRPPSCSAASHPPFPLALLLRAPFCRWLPLA